MEQIKPRIENKKIIKDSEPKVANRRSEIFKLKNENETVIRNYNGIIKRIKNFYKSTNTNQKDPIDPHTNQIKQYTEDIPEIRQ